MHLFPVAAVIVGAVALLFAIIPLLSFIAWLPAVAAIVLGIIGLVQKNRRRGLAWTGLGLGLGAWITAIAVSVASVAGLAGAVSDAAESAAPTAIASEPAAEPAVEEAPEQAPAEEAAPDVPADYRSALNQAETYSSMLHLSKAGIYDQLVSEYGGKFTPEEAQYAVDNLG